MVNCDQFILFFGKLAEYIGSLRGLAIQVEIQIRMATEKIKKKQNARAVQNWVRKARMEAQGNEMITKNEGSVIITGILLTKF